MSGLGLTFLRRGGQAHPTAGLPYIKFKDTIVAEICISRWSSDGIGLTYEDAAKVTSIGTKASPIFSGRADITSFEEFQYFTGVTSILAEYNGTTGQYDGAFANCTNLTKIKLPPSLTTIGQYSFNGCTSLAIDLTNELLNVSSIGRNSLQTTLAYGDVIAPSLTSLLNNAMRGTMITRVLDLGKITSILGSTSSPFYGCGMLSLAIIPSTMTSMPGGAFYYGNENLATIICKAVTPPSIQNWTFTAATQSYYVPDESVDAYKTAANWSAYASKIKGINELPSDMYNELKNYLI